MTTSSHNILSTKTALSLGAGFGVRAGRVGSRWAGYAGGPAVVAVTDGAYFGTRMAADRNLDALAARCAG